MTAHDIHRHLRPDVRGRRPGRPGARERAAGRHAPRDPKSAPARLRSRIAAAVRARPVAAFVAWFLTVGWAVALVPLAADAAFDLALPFQPFAIGSTLLGGLLPALAVTRIVGGPDAVRGLLARAVRWRVPVRWYLLALTLLPATATLLILALLGAPDTSSSIPAALLSGLVLQTAVALVSVNLAEEVVWTGFVQTRLQALRTPARAAVLTAGLFTLQHVPLFLVEGGAAGVLLAPLFLALAVPFRALAAWFDARTASVLLVGILHASANGAAGGSGFGTWGEGLLARLYDSDLASAMALLAAVPAGAVVLIAWSTGSRRRR